MWKEVVLTNLRETACCSSGQEICSRFRNQSFVAVRSENLKAVTMSTAAYCLDPEDGGSMFLLYIGEILPG
jgi:hypothetical protein